MKKAALVLIPGLEMDSASYRPMLEAIQQSAVAKEVALYAGCLHLDWASVPLRQPEDLKPRLDSVLARMQARGMEHDAPVFHAAHSISTSFLQDFLHRRGGSAGQVLLGGCILRKYCYPEFSYRQPTLTIGAELDGTETIMRQAEQFRIHSDLDQTKFPMVVLPGQTHMQFASGEAPRHLRQEAPPAVRDVEAHRKIGEVVSDFMCARLGLSSGVGRSLEEHLRGTRHILLPLLASQDQLAQQTARMGEGPARLGLFV